MIILSQGCSQKFDHLIHVPIPTDIDSEKLKGFSNENTDKVASVNEKSNYNIALIFKNFETVDKFDFKERATALISYRKNMPVKLYNILLKKFKNVEIIEWNDNPDKFDRVVTIEYVKMEIPTIPETIWGDYENILTLKITVEHSGQSRSESFTEKQMVSGKFTGTDLAGITTTLVISPVLAAPVVAKGIYSLQYAGDIKGYCPGFPQQCRAQLLMGASVQKSLMKISESISNLVNI